MTYVDCQIRYVAFRFTRAHPVLCVDQRGYILNVTVTGLQSTSGKQSGTDGKTY